MAGPTSKPARQDAGWRSTALYAGVDATETPPGTDGGD
jgi:hypothetical protein